jgi:twitching motility protein PilI
MSEELRALRNDPFEQLLRLEASSRAARLDVAAGQAQTWGGLGFRLNDIWLAAPRDDVREVIVPPRLTRVPNVRAWLLGVANVRGSLLTIIDLRQFLGLPALDERRGQRVLVFNSEQYPAGFLVDEVAGHRQFVMHEQRREMVGGSGSFAPYLLSAFVRDGQPWLAFSLHKVAGSDTFKHAGL